MAQTTEIEVCIGGEAIYGWVTGLMGEIILQCTNGHPSDFAQIQIKIVGPKGEKTPLSIYLVDESEYYVYFIPRAVGSYVLTADFCGISLVHQKISVKETRLVNSATSDYGFQGEGLFRAITKVPFTFSIHCMPEICHPSQIRGEMFYNELKKEKVSLKRFEGKSSVSFRYLCNKGGSVTLILYCKDSIIYRKSIPVEDCKFTTIKDNATKSISLSSSVTLPSRSLPISSPTPAAESNWQNPALPKAAAPRETFSHPPVPYRSNPSSPLPIGPHSSSPPRSPVQSSPKEESPITSVSPPRVPPKSPIASSKSPITSSKSPIVPLRSPKIPPKSPIPRPKSTQVCSKSSNISPIPSNISPKSPIRSPPIVPPRSPLQSTKISPPLPASRGFSPRATTTYHTPSSPPIVPQRRPASPSPPPTNPRPSMKRTGGSLPSIQRRNVQKNPLSFSQRGDGPPPLVPPRK